MSAYDVAIVGAGIAGASLAAELIPHASVLMIEAEDQPGYHSTGRSAAFWSETYGGPGVQPLTSASEPALREGGFLAPLGSLHIGRSADSSAIDAFLAAFAGSDVALERVDPRAIVPGIRADWTLGVLEPSCAYIDVAALHGSMLGAARRGGASLLSGVVLERAARRGGVWQLETSRGDHEAAILVNAAGAWADRVALLSGVAPIGIQPYRRTLSQLRVDPPVASGLPHVADINGKFYFKPEAGGRLWLSPHDETPTDPCDAAPEEIDVAVAIDRLERVVDWRVVQVERSWAGLRSFAPDRLPVYGFDPVEPSFFWCAGQGGFGIQTAPAAAKLAAAMLLGRRVPEELRDVDSKLYAVERFGQPVRGDAT